MSVKARGVTAKTEWKYRADLDKLMEYCKEAGITLVRRISADDLFGFRQWLIKADYAAKTVQSAVVLVLQAFKWVGRQSMLPQYRLASVPLLKAKASRTRVLPLHKLSHTSKRRPARKSQPSP